MTERTTGKPSHLQDLSCSKDTDQELPAGKYVVETGEELIQGLSFP